MDRNRHFPELDGLRGLAALVVLVSHSANLGMLPAIVGHGFGKTGVAIFFTLSGFLMATLFDGVRFDRVGVTRYAIARSSRVLPLYLIVVACAAILMQTGYNAYGMSIDELGASLLLVRAPSILWSVPVEVQFYVVFLGLWWARECGRETVAIMSLLTIQLVAVILMTGSNDAHLAFWLHYFLIGVMIAWRRDRLPEIGFLPWVALIAILCLPPGFRERVGPAWNDPFVLVTVALVMVCAVRGQFRWMRHPLLVRYGAISFGLYLLHLPILMAVKQFSPLPTWSDFVCGLLLSTLAAHASLRWIEKPVMFAMRRPPREHAATA